MDPLPYGIECLQKAGLRVTHLWAKLFEGVRFHVKGNLNHVVITPKVNAVFGCVEAAAWIWKTQWHHLSPRTRSGVEAPSGRFSSEMLNVQFTIAPGTHRQVMCLMRFSSSHSRPSVRQRTQRRTIFIGISITEDGSQAAKEACRGCRTLDCQGFLSSHHDRRPSRGVEYWASAMQDVAKPECSQKICCKVPFWD